MHLPPHHASPNPLIVAPVASEKAPEFPPDSSQSDSSGNHPANSIPRLIPVPPALARLTRSRLPYHGESCARKLLIARPIPAPSAVHPFVKSAKLRVIGQLASTHAS